MSDLSKIIDKIKKIENITEDKEVAKVLGIKADTLSQQKIRNSIPYKHIINYCNSRNVSLDALFKDEDLPNKKNEEETYKIDMLSAQVSAGTGVVNHEVEVIDTIEIDKVFFKTIPNLDKLKVVEVVGDSMSPTLIEGDFVIINEDVKSYINDIYVINYGGALYVKRLQFKLDGTIIIKSDNKEYDSEIFNPRENQLDFDIIGKVTYTIQRKI